jgi:hypothetical protein
VILRPEPPVFDDARVAAKAAPTKRRWLMSPNARRGAEATFSLVARSVQAGQRPVFCKKDFSPKPPSSMTRWSRLKPLLQKDGFWAFAPNPVFDEARIATKDALIPLCLPHRSCSALVGPSVHAEPRQAADRYPNLRSLEGKSQDGFCRRGFRPEPSSSMTQRVAAEAAPTASIFLAVASLVPAGQTAGRAFQFFESWVLLG